MRDQLGRVCSAEGVSKSRLMKAIWFVGSPVGLPLPLVGPSLPSPAARRSVVARFLVGDLDLAVYWGNWDLSIARRPRPSKSCAHCYYRWDTLPFVEDEWHLLMVCPLYANFRTRLPFRVADVRVKGSEVRGDGCSERNLTSLLRAILQIPDANVFAEFLMRSTAARRRYRASLR